VKFGEELVRLVDKDDSFLRGRGTAKEQTQATHLDWIRDSNLIAEVCVTPKRGVEKAVFHSILFASGCLSCCCPSDSSRSVALCSLLHRETVFSGNITSE
jgi:hypothetical protein